MHGGSGGQSVRAKRNGGFKLPPLCGSLHLRRASNRREAGKRREGALKTITHKKLVSYRTVDYKKIDFTAEISSWRILSHDRVSLK